MMYEVFEHTADLGLRVRAADLETLFSEAGKGLVSLIVANLDAVQPVHEKSFVLPPDEFDVLLFDWLSELLYTFETEHFVSADCRVELSKQGLYATCRGEPFDRTRHIVDHEVKAITYHDLLVEKSGSGWLAEVIVDI